MWWEITMVDLIIYIKFCFLNKKMLMLDTLTCVNLYFHAMFYVGMRLLEKYLCLHKKAVFSQTRANNHYWIPFIEFRKKNTHYISAHITIGAVTGNRNYHRYKQIPVHPDGSLWDIRTRNGSTLSGFCLTKCILFASQGAVRIEYYEGTDLFTKISYSHI